MSPDQIERLFDKFVQADSSMTRRFGGTGLGLSICRELCTAMSGEIWAQSEVARRELLHRTATPGPGGSRRDRCRGAGGPGVRLRRTPLADPGGREDNHVNQLVLKTLLGQVGLEPVLVGNGQEAVAAWERGVWDLILMDVQMPVMDGTAAAREIRRREAETGRPATPIIAVTANAMDHQVEAYLAAGMDGFVAKPIQIAQLFEAIAAVAQGEAETSPEESRRREA